MRRLLLVGALVAGLVAVAIVGRPGGERQYRFDAIFDTARGMVPGQLVKIAGAKVGTVREVALTADRKARMTFDVDRRFGPFHADARCRILPEGFVSENFVECDPGSPRRGALRVDAATGRPTVPVGRTQVSVTLQQVIDTFSLPVSQRVRVLLTEIGGATIGRGGDLNALLRRANPALEQTRELLAILRRQRGDLRSGIEQTDRVLAQLAGRDAQIREFVGQAATVAGTTAQHRGALRASIRRLPPLLDELDRSLTSFDVASRNLAPTARRLRAAAPGLAAVHRQVPAFSRAGVPSVRSLAAAAREGRAAAPALTPVVRRLADVSGRIAAPMASTRQFLDSLRDTGGVESILNMLYGLTTLSTTFDGVSHMLSVSLVLAAKCFVNQADPSCSQKFDGPGKGRIPINGPGGEPLSAGRPSNEPGAAPRAAAGRSSNRTYTAKDLSERSRRDLVRTIDQLLGK
ncbi:MlaD family protein [Patulibacter brassicae]|uniref:MlaD family protein n=1 Tax=Patulibacter brassicae TaxID=1705717 RepID=A0ABU4VQ70_9ACTN|nr:MlaD family protein [Patulibacter brassicae]MDX8153779.1 MlaD family protein [Patulibacter brassicae]